MSLRWFQGFIVVFWLFSMGWLTKTLLAPDHGGMTPVDPRRPLSAFFGWNDSTRLTLLQDGKKLGEISVLGASGEGQLPSLSVSGTLLGNVAPAVLGTFVSFLVKFNEDYTPNGGALSLRIPSRDLDVKASKSAPEAPLHAQVTMAGETIFAHDGASNESPLNPGILGMFGQNPAAGMLLGSGVPSGWDWQVKAFQGRYRLAGRTLPVFLIIVSTDQQDAEVRIYLSKAGEPLEIGTDFGFQAISEVLVPIPVRSQGS